MHDQATTNTKPGDDTLKHHLPGEENPRNIPEHDLDAAPPQPDVPERSEIEKQQDQQPVTPGPLIHGPRNPTGQQKELVNG